MMQGHAPQLKWQHSVTSTNEDENKENSTPTASSVKQYQFNSNLIQNKSPALWVYVL